MSEHNQHFLTDTIDRIEASYEFMLAYAAQGRDTEASASSGPSIRQFLTDLEQSLELLSYGVAEKVELLNPPAAQRATIDHFRALLIDDAEKARTAVRLVLAVSSISSQLVDNLNASTHLRCLLTDMFLLDEALQLVEKHASPGA